MMLYRTYVSYHLNTYHTLRAANDNHDNGAPPPTSEIMPKHDDASSGISKNILADSWTCGQKGRMWKRDPEAVLPAYENFFPGFLFASYVDFVPSSNHLGIFASDWQCKFLLMFLFVTEKKQNLVGEFLSSHTKFLKHRATHLRVHRLQKSTVFYANNLLIAKFTWPTSHTSNSVDKLNKAKLSGLVFFSW